MIASIIIGLIVAVIFVSIIVKQIKDHKSGKGGCSCGCGGCSSDSICHPKK